MLNQAKSESNMEPILEEDSHVNESGSNVEDRVARPTQVRASSTNGSAMNKTSKKSKPHYEVVSSEVKQSLFRRAIPTMPVPMAVFCCIINLLTPGIGTLIAAFSVFCGSKHQLDKNSRAFGYNLLAAFLQMATFLFILGWVWSILWGMHFVRLATGSDDSAKDSDTGASSFYIRRQSSISSQACLQVKRTSLIGA